MALLLFICLLFRIGTPSIIQFFLSFFCQFFCLKNCKKIISFESPACNFLSIRLASLSFRCAISNGVALVNSLTPV